MSHPAPARAGDRRYPRTLVDSVEWRAVESPDGAGFLVREEAGWRAITNEQFRRDVCKVAAALRDRGVERGDRVAILARPCYEWEVADKATMYLGGISVGVDPRSSAEDVEYILGSVSPVGVFVENRDLLGPIGDADLGSLRFVCVMRRGSEPTPGDDGGGQEVLDLQDHLRSEDSGEFEPLPRPDDLAVIIFTSGTTGRPKGIPLRHRQLVAMLPTLHELFRQDLLAVGDLRTVAWVPLHNGTGRLMSSANHFLGVAQHFVDDPTTLFDTIRAIDPHYLVVVPRVLERVYQQVRARLAESSLPVRAALRTLMALRRGHLAPLVDRLLLWRLRAAIWGRDIRFLISGSAPVDPAILRFFDGLGVPTLEVYGLSEIPVLITMNRRGRIRYGSVGEPVPGMDVKIEPDGEIMVRSDAALERYWGEEESDLLDGDGFLKTGDLGELRNGYLYIVGRKKEIIKTSTGQRISPVEVELAYRDIPGVDQLVAIGDRRPYLTALVAMEEDFLSRLEEDGTAVERYLRSELERRGNRLAANRRVKRFAVLPRPLSVEAGELTPTLKVRRPVIEKHFREVIDDLYRESGV